jgi:hypothetical protein
MSQASTSTLPDDRQTNPKEANASAGGRNGGGRERNGRFALGNPGGPGNPHARSTAKFYKAFREVAETQFTEVVQEIFKRAKEGDWHAMRMVLDYTLGKPAPAMNPDRVEIDEFELHCQSAVSTEKFAASAAAHPVEAVNEFNQFVRPYAAKSFDRMISKEFRADERRERRTKEKARREREMNKNDDWGMTSSTPPPAEFFKMLGLPVPGEVSIVTPPTADPAGKEAPPSPNGVSASPSPSPNGETAPDAPEPPR